MRTTKTYLLKILHLFYIKLDCYSLNLQEKTDFNNEREDVDFTEILNQNDLEMLAISNCNNYVATHITALEQKLLEPGVRLFVVLKDDKVACYSFIDTNKIYESATGLRNNLGHGQAYLFKDFTFPQFRGLGLHKYSIYKRLEVLSKEKYKEALVTIYSDNYFSKKSYLSMGFKQKSSMRVFKLFGKGFTIINND